VSSIPPTTSRLHPSVDDFGPSAFQLMEVARGTDFHHRVEWYRTQTSHAVDPADEVRVRVLENRASGEALALLPLLRPRGRVAPRQARTALRLTTSYSSLYAPILALGHDEPALLELLFENVCASSPTWGVERLPPTHRGRTLLLASRSGAASSGDVSRARDQVGTDRPGG
jgi:hypothetical protein